MPSPIFAERYGAVVEVLANARRAAGITQSELASRLGRPQSYVSKVERRERRVDPIEFADWCSAVDAEPEKLFGALLKSLASSSSISGCG